jgi:hypothetical protein
MNGVLLDLLVVGGCAAIVAGICLWSVPAGVIVGGVLLIGVAALVTLGLGGGDFE